MRVLPLYRSGASRHSCLDAFKHVLKPRYILVLLLSLALLLHNLRSIHLHRQQSEKLSTLQSSVFSSMESRRPVCNWTEWHRSRYASLKYSFLWPRPIFLAMNFYNNEGVLPTFFQELPILLEHLGPTTVYVSIYENESSDRTPELLQKCKSRVVLYLRVPMMQCCSG